MSYGIILEENSKGSSFKPGINDCFLQFIGLTNVNTERYQGTALDLVFEKDGSTKNLRKFPVNKGQIAENLRSNPGRFTKLVNGQPVQLTFDEVYARETSDFSAFVKHIITGYVSAEVYEAAIKAWLAGLNGNEPTFEAFIHMATSVLPPHYAKIPAKVVLGYKRGSVYADVPSDMYYMGHFFTTDANLKELVEPNSKYFKMEPWEVKQPEVHGAVDNSDVPAF